MTPILSDDGLFVFMEPESPKARDLRRDGRCALHCHVPDIIGTAHGEFSASAVGVESTEQATRRLAADASIAPPADRWILFELSLVEAKGTDGRGSTPTWLRWPSS